MENIISFITEDNEEVKFEVCDEVEYNNHKYLLVVEVDDIFDSNDDDEAEGVILKQIQEDNNDVVYELIEDEQEYLMVLELFRQSSENYDLDYIKED